MIALNALKRSHFPQNTISLILHNKPNYSTTILRILHNSVLHIIIQPNPSQYHPHIFSRTRSTPEQAFSSSLERSAQSRIGARTSRSAISAAAYITRYAAAYETRARHRAARAFDFDALALDFLRARVRRPLDRSHTRIYRCRRFFASVDSRFTDRATAARDLLAFALGIEATCHNGDGLAYESFCLEIFASRWLLYYNQ